MIERLQKDINGQEARCSDDNHADRNPRIVQNGAGHKETTVQPEPNDENSFLVEHEATDENKVDDNDNADNGRHGLGHFEVGQPSDAGRDVSDDQKEHNDCDDLAELAVGFEHPQGAAARGSRI